MPQNTNPIFVAYLFKILRIAHNFLLIKQSSSTLCLLYRMKSQHNLLTFMVEVEVNWTEKNLNY